TAAGGLDDEVATLERPGLGGRHHLAAHAGALGRDHQLAAVPLRGRLRLDLAGVLAAAHRLLVDGLAAIELVGRRDGVAAHLTLDRERVAGDLHDHRTRHAAAAPTAATTAGHPACVGIQRPRAGE